MKKYCVVLLLPMLAWAQVVPVTPTSPDPFTAAINRNLAYLDASKMSYAGAWSATVAYRPQALVMFEGKAYVNLLPGSLGRKPTAEPNHWHALGAAPYIPRADVDPAGAICPETGAQAIYAKRLWICLAAGSPWEQVLTSTGQGAGALELQMGTPRWNPAVGSMLVYIDAAGVLRYRDANGRVRAVR